MCRCTRAYRVHKSGDCEPACNFACCMPTHTIRYHEDSKIFSNLLHVKCIFVIGSPR